MLHGGKVHLKEWWDHATNQCLRKHIGWAYSHTTSFRQLLQRSKLWSILACCHVSPAVILKNHSIPPHCRTTHLFDHLSYLCIPTSQEGTQLLILRLQLERTSPSRTSPSRTSPSRTSPSKESCFEEDKWDQERLDCKTRGGIWSLGQGSI